MKKYLTILFALSALAGCNTATVSLDYATTSIGTQNGGKYLVGKIFKWIPSQSRVIDQASVSAPFSINENPNTKDKARSVRGWVVGTNFKLTETQKADIELKSTANTVIEYENYTIRESNDTRGAISSYINSNPEGVAIDWGLDEAISSIKSPEKGNIYYVAVFKTITTSRTNLVSGSEIGGKAEIEVSGVDGKIEVSFKDENEILCEGVQRCFFDIRIYEPYLNNNGNYDFKSTYKVTKRDFFNDLRRGVAQ